MAVERDDVAARLEAWASALGASPLPTAVYDRNGRVRLWNTAAEHLLGWSADELIGEPPPGIPEEERSTFERQVERALRGETVTGVESRRRTKAGEILDVRLAAAPVRDPDGQIIGVVRTFEDVTARKQTEEILRGQAALLDLTFDAILVRDFQTDRIQFWNRGAQELYGFAPDDALGRVSHDLLRTVHPFASEAVEAELVRNGRWEGELVHTSRDGRQIAVASRWALEMDGDEPVAILETNTDITERVRNEQERQNLLDRERQARAEAEEAEYRFALLADAGAVLASALDYETTLRSLARLVVSRIADRCAIHLVDGDGQVRPITVVQSESAEAEPARDLERRNPIEPNAPTGVPHVLRTGRPELVSEISDETLEAISPDPEFRRYLRELGITSWMVVPLTARGHLLGAITFSLAGSGRRYGPEDLALAQELAVRAALAVDNSRLYREAQRVGAERSAILSQMADGVAIVDPQGHITFLNHAARRLVGDHPLAGSLESATTAYQIMTVAGDPYSTEQLPLMRALRERELIVDAQWRLRRMDGTDVVLQGSASPVLGSDGELLGAVSTFHDVTAQVAVEEQKADFLAAVAHDLRTPLTGLKGFVQLLQRRIAKGIELDPEQLGEGLARIEQNAGRMASMIDELLDVSHLEMGQGLDLNRRPTDLVSLVSRCVASQQETDTHREIVVHSIVPKLVGDWDAERLERVISNLLSNAVKYSPEPTPVTVGLSEQRDGGTRWAVVRVEDRGIGIPKDDLDHVFERFHRGRNVSRETSGTGIGLAGAKQIVEQHGGRIEVESEEGAGSAFTVYLPLDPD